MHGLDEAQRAQLAADLTARLAAMTVAIAADPHSADDDSGTATDARPVTEIETAPADKATVRLLNDLALETAGHQQVQRSLLRRALAKFADGSYGACEECGMAIGFSRLQARPEARLCIVCQTQAEKR